MNASVLLSLNLNFKMYKRLNEKKKESKSTNINN